MKVEIKIKGWDGIVPEHKAARVEMWYDRHYRHWVIYPVDAEGNQWWEAQYGFGKAEALRIKRDIEREHGIMEG